LLVELVSVTKRNEYTDHAAHPFDAGLKVTSSLSWHPTVSHSSRPA